ncbi:hypothetical protein AD006_28955 (plasmid) [Pseudonocardia sp. EC080610-09]|uniref:hypothetical protein n=1 Tax=unclassified Pseudonocardia TaxID=2619320 RepID=UPI0007067302|nr:MULTISPECIES: hypothetical protein [unclassified Pseudonocardia]ALL79331.1 hypothetical protein AD006_28955 [Pseudonocardia sp. EC080610-09]ALL85302.1 hypothetical protein AD017_29345 [Pseudonocardia sp. EC080619-01]
MPLDFPTLVPLVVSVLGALSVGSLILQWAASGKDRRAARAEVLRALGAVEAARWKFSERDAYQNLRDAIRDLETAALLARVPRRVLIPYSELSIASLWWLMEEADLTEPVGLDLHISDAVHDAAEIVSRATWETPATRWAWLETRLTRLEQSVAAVDDDRFQAKIRSARRGI